MVKNDFKFILKVLFVLMIFKCLLWLFGHAGKRFDEKTKVNSKIYDVTYWQTNNNNTHIVQYLKKVRESDTEIWSALEFKARNYFPKKSCRK